MGASRALFTVALMAVLTASAHAQIYRCGNAYQSTPCSGGRVVDASPIVTTPTPKTATVYLCESYQGRTFWASQHCNLRQPPSILKRMVEVPAHLSWDDQVRVAKRARREADALVGSGGQTGAAGSPGAPGLSGGSSSSGASRMSCQGYSDALRHNESQARAGGTAQWMEYLSEERRRIHREQSRAGCR